MKQTLTPSSSVGKAALSSAAVNAVGVASM